MRNPSNSEVALALALLMMIVVMCIMSLDNDKATSTAVSVVDEEIVKEEPKVSAMPLKHTLTAHRKRPAIEPVIFEVVTAEKQETVEEPELLYKVDGVVIGEGLQRFLLNQLRMLGHEEFFEYAICQIYQESRGDVNAVAPNGKDKGILQFREMYWAEYADNEGLHNASVFDPFAQIYVYVRLMCRRLDSGLLVQEAISRHYTSDYGEYNARYVADVLQWYETLERIR